MINELPVLDLSAAASADPKTRARFHDALHTAARDVGFFHLTGHGITPPPRPPS
ncbi:hypothetical protein GCM10020000_07630 [Streptomyces olivoverticillatus]